MVEDNNMTSPHMRMWQFTRSVLGDIETKTKRVKESKKHDFCKVDEKACGIHNQETTIPQKELNRIC